jgi:2-polyprenyl-6-methoxyphenol hydroxylase-like FAD-dependent oxidoreductase
LNDEQQLQCSLLVGADGARSRVRDLAGIEFSENDYQQKAIVCNIQYFKLTKADFHTC